MINFEINSLGEAVAFVMSKLHCASIKETWSGIAVVITFQGENYLVTYKRDYYRNFKYHFPNCKQPDGTDYGWAQVMNKILIDRACEDYISFMVFVMPNKKAYKIKPTVFKEFIMKHNTEVPHLKGEMSIPLQYFERFV